MLRIGQVETTATSDSKYTDGSVAGGVAATRLRAAAFNAIQEELANIVESAALTLNVNDTTQVLTGLKKLLTGRLLNVRVFNASGTYTPTSGTKFVVVEVQGAGGAGGGAVTTAASTASTGSGGLSGAYTKARVDSPSATTVVVGAAGVPVTGAAGGVGGDSSFGAVFASGGLGGNIMAAGTSTSVVVAAGSYPAIDTSGGIYGVGLGYSQSGIRLSGTSSISGVGGSSQMGAGGGPRGTSGSGFPANGYGGAGGGANCTAIASYAGGAGGAGIVIVWEYA